MNIENTQQTKEVFDLKPQDFLFEIVANPQHTPATTEYLPADRPEATQNCPNMAVSPAAQESEKIAFSLEIKFPEGNVQLIDLPQGTTLLGQDQQCQIIIADPYVSRKHIQFTCVNGEIIVEDLNSRNGTFFRMNRPQHLQTDDEILIGGTVN